MALCVPVTFTSAQDVDDPPEFLDDPSTVVQEVKVKGLKANPRGKAALPTLITNKKELTKAVSSKEALAVLQKKVDFAKSKVLLFSWQGSGGDRLTPSVSIAKEKPTIYFRHRVGFTDDIAPHVHLFVIPKDAKWSVGKGRAPEEEEDLNLENLDLGLDPEVELKFDTKRIEDLSVPRPEDPTDTIGIGSVPGPPGSIPLPPGFGRDDFPRANFGQIRGSGYFSGRSGATRKRMVIQNGGNTESEAAVARGLRWLALHQAKARLKNGKVGGYWSLDKFPQHAQPPFKPNKATGTGRTKNDVAGTALGLLPFLGAGMTHKAGKYQKEIGAAALWLLEQQDRKTGSFDRRNGYAHGLASMAMVELYGLTGDPLVKRSAQMAVNFIVYAQDPMLGGWRYVPRGGSDTSVTGWQVHALYAARQAGLNVPKHTLRGAERFLDSVEAIGALDIARGPGNPKPGPRGLGKFGYTGPESPRPTMTAVGLLCRQYLGARWNDPSLLNGASYLSTLHTATRIENSYVNPALPYLKMVSPTLVRQMTDSKTVYLKSPMNRHYSDTYFLYYATHVMSQMNREFWDDWNLGIWVSPEGRQVRVDHLMKWDEKGDGLTKKELLLAAEGDEGIEKFLAAEWDRVKRADKNKDGKLTKDELKDKEYLTWVPGMRDTLVYYQDKDKDSPHFGSWDPKGDRHCTMGGRIMKTSLCLLCLEVYYQKRAK